MADTYGVGVRAGVITPQIHDEEQFRGLVGLPAASKEVVEAWEADGGTRRPITLKAGDAFEAEQENLVAGNEDEEDRD